MKQLGNRALDRLRRGADEPDVSGTKYRILGLLGRGGMGAVYVAEDSELGRSVALKVNAASSSGASELADRLRHEAQVIARLEHPGIVPVHDVGTLADGRVYYAMKLVRGQQLDAWLLDAPARSAVLRVFQRICEAVAFAHHHGVIHRDLKPANVMIGEYGEALVMDWGLAKQVGAHVSLLADDRQRGGARRADPGIESADTVGANARTQMGAVMGTPAYMAPEQARGAIDELDARTDVFALGAIFYYALSRREPFRGGSAAEIVKKVLEDEPPPLEDVPRALASICRKAMAKDPAARYGSAAAMAEDVGCFLDGRPVSAHTETVVERIARIASRYRVLLVLLAAYLVMRAVLLAFARD